MAQSQGLFVAVLPVDHSETQRFEWRLNTDQWDSLGILGQPKTIKNLSKKLLVENDLEKFGRFLLGYLAAISRSV